MLRLVYQDSPYQAAIAVNPQWRTWQWEVGPTTQWQGLDGIERAQAATRQLLAEFQLTGLSPTAPATAAPYSLFEWTGLGGMLDTIYGGNPVAALRAVVPEIRPWRFGPAPPRYWQGVTGSDRAVAATRQLIAELGWGGLAGSDVAQRFNATLLRAHGLAGMLKQVYAMSPYAALHALYNDLHPWQMAHVPGSYWQGNDGRAHAQRATRWMLGRLGLSAATLANHTTPVDVKVFAQWGLYGMLLQVYDGSPYAALTDVVPDIPPWQLGITPLGYWQDPEGDEHARAAVRWLINQQGVSATDPEQIATILHQETFARAGLGGLFLDHYGYSPYAVLKDLFPDLLPWQMGTVVPQGYWQGAEGRRHAHAAIRHLLGSLNLTDAPRSEVARQITRATLERAGLGGMLAQLYGGSLRRALDDFYQPLELLQSGECQESVEPGC